MFLLVDGAEWSQSDCACETLHLRDSSAGRGEDATSCVRSSGCVSISGVRDATLALLLGSSGVMVGIAT